jgi:hypothetical protein
MAIGMVWKAQDVHTEDSKILREVRMNRSEMTGKDNVYYRDSEGIITVHSIDGYPNSKFVFVVVVCPNPLDYRTEFPVPYFNGQNTILEKKISCSSNRIDVRTLLRL